MIRSHLRILIADDHAIIRVGLTSMLANEEDIEIVAEAENGEEAIDLFRIHLPDVAVFDVRMPVMDGIEALKLLRGEFPDAKVLMLSTAELDDEVALAVEAGADGYLTKSVNPGALADAIRRIADGESQFSPGVRLRLEQRQHLSPRELEVLVCLSCGRANKQIADDLNLSEHTIKTHVKSILVKLQAEDRTGAVAAAYKKGLLKI
jgi:two-component system, NarL family, response regulator